MTDSSLDTNIRDMRSRKNEQLAHKQHHLCNRLYNYAVQQTTYSSIWVATVYKKTFYKIGHRRRHHNQIRQGHAVRFYGNVFWHQGNKHNQDMLISNCFLGFQTGFLCMLDNAGSIRLTLRAFDATNNGKCKSCTTRCTYLSLARFSLRVFMFRFLFVNMLVDVSVTGGRTRSLPGCRSLQVRRRRRA